MECYSVPWKVRTTTLSEVYGPAEKSKSYARPIVYLACGVAVGFPFDV